MRIFHIFISPQVFHTFTQRWSGYVGWLAVLFLSIGLPVSLFFSPADYQQGEAVRIMYIHVPHALLAMGCYVCMGGCSIVLLVWRVKLAGLFLRSLAKLGVWLSFLALITGAYWGKPMWGAWWIWDARLTSMFILWLLYLSIIAIQDNFRSHSAAERGMAILTLVGLIDLPIIHYSVNWWYTLHQSSSFSLWQKPTIDSSMLWPLACMMIGFVSLSAWIVMRYTQILLTRYKL